MKTKEPAPSNTKVFLRDIGRALEKKLYEYPQSSFHWISVLNEDNVQAVPTREWLFNDSLIHIGVVNGNNEGCLVYVHAQGNRYQPDLLTTLFRIKFLCNANRVFDEARIVYEFFESNEFFELTGQT